MTARLYTLDDFRHYLKKLPKQMEAAAIRGIHVGAQRAIGILIHAGDTAPPASDNGKPGAFNTGGYRGGWKAELLADGAVLRNIKAYADVIEGGRRAGAKAPPRKAIELWAMRKLGLSAEEAKLAAYPIQRAIAKRGLKPRLVMGNAQAQIVEVVIEEMRAEVAKDLKTKPMQGGGSGGGE